MGISRDSVHKRRATGGKRAAIRKKRKFEMGRPPALTRIGPKRIHEVRVRGGGSKFRALRLDAGNFSWGSHSVARKTRLLNVVYNASNNELVRTNTLVKNCIVQIDAAPFRQWFKLHYGVELGKKKAVALGSSGPSKKEEEAGEQGHAATDEVKLSKKALAKQKARVAPELDVALKEQFSSGRLYACLASRPGQSGRADGYILEGPELQFYLRKLHKKKGKSGGKE